MRLAATADLTNGLVAYYPFNGNANDASGNGYDGVVYGATLDTDRFGQADSCYRFTGTTDWIRANVGPSYFSSDFTFAVWVNFSDSGIYPDDYLMIVSGDTWYIHCHGLGPGYGSSLYQKVNFYQQPEPSDGSDRIGSMYSSNIFETNLWYHLAITRQGLSFSMFVNGVLSAQTVSTNQIQLFGSYLQFGNDFQNPYSSFHGKLDEIRIYSRALSATEIQALYNMGSGQPALSNVRASQRAGTNLVDVWYDLSGATAPVFVSVAISTNGGVSYNLQPANLVGDGVTTPIGSGTSFHLVWDAGADWPGQYSRQMRVLVSVPASGGTAQANSPIFTVDTRSAPTGTLTGLVQGNGTPLANAQVRIDATPFTTSTDANGRFTLASVPAGSGYLLKVSAAGFASKQVPGITVTAGTTDLGTIQLAPLSGPYRLLPLQPDVNPPVTQVEDGGVAYRYYRLVPVNQNDNPGGTLVSLRIAGGSTIPQTGATLDDWQGYQEDYWPGFQAGTADGDGTVRLRIPSSALGGPGASATLEVVESGTVKQTFTAQVLLRQYDQVWKQKLGAGASVGDFVSLGLDTSAESDLRHTVVNGVATAESISRIRMVRGGLSLGLDVGDSLSVSSAHFNLSAGAAATAAAEASAAVELSSTYGFDNPNSTDPSENAMKLYVDLGNVIAGVPSPAGAFYDFVELTIEPLFLGSNLQSVEGDVIVQGGADLGGQVGFIMGGSQPAQVGVEAEGDLSSDAEWIGGTELSFGGASESAIVVGRAQNGSTTGLSLQLGSVADLMPSDSSLAQNFSGGLKVLAKSWTRQGQSSAYRNEALWTVSLGAGIQNAIPGWGQYDPEALYGAYARDFTETREQTNGSVLVNYERAVYAAQQYLGLNLNLDLGFGVNVQVELDQGAEAVNERGAISQSRYWPTESYPAVSSALFPAQSWGSLLGQWGNYASGLVSQILNQAVNTVESAGNTVIQAGEQGWNATLSFGQGVMAGGSQVISTWVTGVFSGAHPHDKNPPTTFGPLPPVGASNYIYGVSGIYRFASSNSFNGSGTLAIGYSAAQAEGLYEADFRIYRLDDNTNRWVLVGGAVDMTSNIVSATITNLGTYAVAPPLPTGSLWLQPSTNSLSADGVSQMTVVVTNLLLNTEGSATQAWLFTASAVGVDILSSDADTNTPGVQIVSTNATLTLQLRAPVGGTYASVSLKSVAGDAYGQLGINLADTTPPATPANVIVIAGQSRIWVSWATNSEPDLAGYRVYYRAGAVGPPWDGTATVEGFPSPVQVNGTNVLLRGLSLGTNYFVAVSAVDTTGNESLLSPAVSVTPSQAVPTAPTGVAARFGSDGTNILMWALSEDDGYNDRDVSRYDVFQAVLPGGSYVKVGEVPAGIGLYSGTNLSVPATQYVGYAVSAVASNGLSSALVPATRLMANGVDVDTDGDGIPDSWMIQYFGHPTGLASDQSFAWNDPAGDGLSNLQKYVLGLNPLVPARPYLQPLLSPANGNFALYIQGLFGRSVALEVSTNLANWQTLTNLTSTNAVIYFEDPGATNSGSRFYRAVVP